ncbi:MAG: hypothetical protein ABI612_00505 [Betaproteobacteria bacterium]
MTKRPAEAHALDKVATADADPQQRLEELIALMMRLETARDHERRQLASDLHGRVVSTLSASKMECDWLVRPGKSAEDMARGLARISESLAQTIQYTRLAIDRLFPAIVEHLGFSAAIKQQVAEFNQGADADVELSIDERADAIPPDHAIALYRLLQQVLAQITAGGDSKIRIGVSRSANGVELHIAGQRTDGAAVDLLPPDSDAFLLMQERVWRSGGQLHMTADGGTSVILPIA